MRPPRNKRIYVVAGLIGLIAGIALIASRLARKMIAHNRESGTALPPGSMGLPVIGETLSFRKNPHAFFEERVARYGPVFKTRILGDPIVCFAGHEAFNFLVTHPYFDRDDANPSHIQELLADRSLPLIDGPEHARLRAPVLAAFEQEAMASYLRIVERTTRAYLARWEGMREFDWLDEYKRLSASLCAALLLGAEPGTDGEDLMRVLERFMAGLTAIPINLPGTTLHKALGSRDTLLGLIDEAVKRHEVSEGGDVLHYFLNAVRDASPAPDKGYVRSQMVHMFFAAYGGIFRTLTLMCMDLGRRADVRDLARAEVKRESPSGELTLDSLAKLTYLENVTREVRRHNRIFASTFFESVTQPFEYKGFHIPAGWKATGAIYTTMQDGSVFTSPERFDPGRFADGRAEHTRAEDAYVPQGGGPMTGHRCPAEDFTSIFMKAVAVLLLREYDWEIVTEDLSLNSEPSPMPRNGLEVEFVRVSG